VRLLTYILVGGGAAIAVIALAVVLLDNGEQKPVAPQADAGQTSVTAKTTTESPAADSGSDADTADAEATEQATATAPATDPAVSIDLAQVTPGGEAVFAGKSAPNAQVTVFEGDVVLGTTTANADGEWVVVPEKALGPGEHLVSVGATDETGDTAVASLTLAIKVGDTEDEQPLVALLPQSESDVPKLLQSPDDKPEAATIVVGSAETTETVESGNAADLEVTPPPGFTEANDQAPAAVPALAPRSLSWKMNGELVIAGVSRGGERVVAKAAGRDFGEAGVTGNGGWQISGRVDIETPRRVMSFALLDGDGQTVATYELPVASRDLSQGMDGSKLVVVQQGDALWRIAYRSYGEGIKYVDIVRRNAAAIDDPDLIFPNQIFAIPQ